MKLDMKYIDAEKLKARVTYLCADANFYQQKAMKESNREDFVSFSGEIIAYAQVLSFIDSLQQEQQGVDLEKASRHVYESWMGGTMDDVRRDMVELGKALNARKEEKK